MNKLAEYWNDPEHANEMMAASIGWAAGWVLSGGIFLFQYKRDRKKIRAALTGRVEVMANAYKKVTDTMLDPMKNHDDLVKVIEEEQAFVEMVLQQPLF